MILAFAGNWDATALGTLALAVATFASLRFARRSLGQMQQQIKLGQHQLEQTQREIELSRSEVEEAHRPVVVPVADPTAYMDLGADGANRERRLQLEQGGRLFVPVQNIGSGPALNVEATVSGVSLPDEGRTEHQTSARIAGLGEGDFRAPRRAAVLEGDVVVHALNRVQRRRREGLAHGGAVPARHRALRRGDDLRVRADAAPVGHSQTGRR
jgi:hypothetical protein